jgi:hypothetical protein
MTLFYHFTSEHAFHGIGLHGLIGLGRLDKLAKGRVADRVAKDLSKKSPATFRRRCSTWPATLPRRDCSQCIYGPGNNLCRSSARLRQ